jgi:hypothetical protein
MIPQRPYEITRDGMMSQADDVIISLARVSKNPSDVKRSDMTSQQPYDVTKSCGNMMSQLHHVTSPRTFEYNESCDNCMPCSHSPVESSSSNSVWMTEEATGFSTYKAVVTSSVASNVVQPQCDPAYPTQKRLWTGFDQSTCFATHNHASTCTSDQDPQKLFGNFQATVTSCLEYVAQQPPPSWTEASSVKRMEPSSSRDSFTMNNQQVNLPAQFPPLAPPQPSGGWSCSDFSLHALPVGCQATQSSSVTSPATVSTSRNNIPWNDDIVKIARQLEPSAVGFSRISSTRDGSSAKLVSRAVGCDVVRDPSFSVVTSSDAETMGLFVNSCAITNDTISKTDESAAPILSEPKPEGKLPSDFNVLFNIYLS